MHLSKPVCAICSLLIVSACVGDQFDSGLGATPGGVKDLKLARELIEAGLVPPPDALLVEAMFAEHELGLEGPTCARTLCLRAAAGIAPELGGDKRGWAQVGLSSTIEPATWQRPSTTFIFTVDVSGSMGWGRAPREDSASAGELSRALLHQLIDKLMPDDRLALVTYGDNVSEVLPLTSGGERELGHRRVDELRTNGSTDMEAGMRLAYQLGRSARGQTDQVRVIVFTDVQPNVGATGPSEFQTMVAEAAAQDVHTSVLALGVGIGPEVLRAMASLRGANAYSLTRVSHIAEFMEESYPWFTTPIAYDLKVNADLAAGWGINRGLGFPAADDESQVGLKAASVFLSRRKGALLVALEPTATPALALSGHFDLGYVEPSGQPVEESLPFSYDGPLDERGQGFSQRAVARTTALGVAAEAMHQAAKVYAEDPLAAARILLAAQERFTADVAALGDADLAPEVELLAALTKLVQRGAPQGTLYGP